MTSKFHQAYLDVGANCFRAVMTQRARTKFQALEREKQERSDLRSMGKLCSWNEYDEWLTVQYDQTLADLEELERDDETEASP